MSEKDSHNLFLTKLAKLLKYDHLIVMKQTVLNRCSKWVITNTFKYLQMFVLFFVFLFPIFGLYGLKFDHFWQYLKHTLLEFFANHALFLETAKINPSSAAIQCKQGKAVRKNWVLGKTSVDIKPTSGLRSYICVLPGFPLMFTCIREGETERERERERRWGCAEIACVSAEANNSILERQRGRAAALSYSILSRLQ